MSAKSPFLTGATRLPLPRRVACLTVDVEYDHHDLVAPARYSDALCSDTAWRFFQRLGRDGIPTTAFVVGQLLVDLPVLADRLHQTFADIQLHSFSHRRQEPDSIDEIRRGTDVFERVLGTRPRGYRAPLGLISSPGLARLADDGFCYDSSVFPSLRPGAFDHRRVPLAPLLVRRHPRPFLEFPIGAVRGVRLLLSVSYMKLVGQTTYTALLHRATLPELVVIGCHFHDLVVAQRAYSMLPLPWRMVYSRGKRNGHELLYHILGRLRELGYEFRTLSAVADELIARLDP